MRVSVIIPVYNSETFLRRALDSALKQSWPDVEIIAVDDGSSDGSGAILSDYAGNGFIKLIKQANLGMSAALNRGIGAATGDYIKFLDHDDVLSERHIEEQLKSLQGTTDHLSACQVCTFVEDPARSIRRESVTDRDEDDPLAWVLDAMEYDKGMMPGWRWLIPRKVLERVGNWDERLSVNNDFEFSIRLLLQSAGVRYAPNAILHYCRVEGSLGGQVSRKALESAWLASQKSCELITSREDSPRARQIIANRMQEWLFRFYPSHPDLAVPAEAEILRLGGSDQRLQGGGLLMLLSRVLTWKQIRLLQEVVYRSGWNWVLRAKMRRKRKQLRAAELQGAKS